MRLIFHPFCLLLLALLPVHAHATDPEPSSSPEPEVHEFTDEFERGFNLRSIGQVQLTNLRGNITLIGWSQDRIRVVAKRHVFVENEAAAKAAFSVMDIRYEEADGNIECSAQYGRGLDISQRVQERERPMELQSKMDMVVYAPSHLKVKLWTAAGNSSLKNWLSTAELRTISGDISAENVKGERVSALCQNCSVKFDGIRGSIRAITDGGNLSVENVQGPEVFFETGAGNITAAQVNAEQLYVTKSGSIVAKDLQGHVEFQTLQGNVDISGLSGFASGRTESGSIHLKATEWEFQDKALIESQRGNISLSLPFDFAGEVDFAAPKGNLQSEFLVRRAAGQADAPKHLVGRVGDRTTDLLRVSSTAGNVEILKLVR